MTPLPPTWNTSSHRPFLLNCFHRHLLPAIHLLYTFGYCNWPKVLLCQPSLHLLAKLPKHTTPTDQDLTRWRVVRLPVAGNRCAPNLKPAKYLNASNTSSGKLAILPHSFLLRGLAAPLQGGCCAKHPPVTHTPTPSMPTISSQTYG